MSANDKDGHSRLAEYRSKRWPTVTPEPFDGGLRRPGHFVVQLHEATRRHYDLRLEMDGVLRCWAVPNGPSLDPQEKRLAVQTEDHPVEYLDFEDVIPEDNYGAGPMIVWDRGRWVQREDDQTGENKLLFDLYGHKLRGRWTLIRTKRNPKEWLLIKKVDGHARSGDEAELPPESVYSGLTVEQLGAGESPAADLHKKLKAKKAPRGQINASSVEIMLARTAEQPFSRKGWVFELKYDGYRMIAGVDAREPYLRYRNGGDATDLYPEITPALRGLPFDSLVCDGEVVVMGEDGRPDFGRLARRARLSRETEIVAAAFEHPASYYVFDLLELDGFDLRGLPFSTRKEILTKALPTRGPVRVAEHIPERGTEMFEQVRKMGLEGIMAKRADAAYRGGRSDHWLKMRADRRAAFPIVGWATGKGSRAALGALLLGVQASSGLVYVGRVGTGLRERQIEELVGKLEALRVDAPAIEVPERRSARYANLPKPDDTHWSRPELCCLVRFKEVTAEGLLRHPVFERMLPDQRAHECDVEQPGLQHAAALRPEPEEVEPEPVSASPVAGQTSITRPEKVFWPEDGYTKGDLIDYYRAVAPSILPYLEDRPLVLDRFPDGISGKSFFQKHAPHFTPEWIRTETIHSKSGERDVDYFIVEDAEALVYMANAAAIPLHLWSSRLASIDRPDWTILDLDPKEAPFGDVVKVAKAVKELCDSIGIPCYAKTSGKTGMHVLVPLGGQVSYEHGRMIADLLALIVSRRYPELATVNRSLHSRGDRVYIDAVQNGPGKLLVSPLCVRPFAGATVSTPLRWREVNARLDMHKFTIKTVPRRLTRMKGDPMISVLDDQPDLMGALQLLSEIESR
ncbi:MAG: DNA ligase D [Acidobacteria bacterium]|nr:DNA ligase D [Acidobacteriota bacterium]